MPRTEMMSLPAEEWVEATNADATKLTVQVQSKTPIRLMTAVGAVPPADPNAGVLIQAGFGFDRADIATLIPGVVDATRVYLRAENGKSWVFVSHD